MNLDSLIPQSSWIPTLIALPTLVPFLGAALTLLQGRNARMQRLVTVGAISVALIASGMMLYLTSTNGPYAVKIGGWGGKGCRH